MAQSQPETEESLTTKRVYTTDEFAELLGIRALTLHRWRWKEEGPAFVRIGSAIRYLAEDIEDFLARNRVTPENRRYATEHRALDNKGD